MKFDEKQKIRSNEWKLELKQKFERGQYKGFLDGVSYTLMVNFKYKYLKKKKLKALFHEK